MKKIILLSLLFSHLTFSDTFERIKRSVEELHSFQQEESSEIILKPLRRIELSKQALECDENPVEEKIESEKLTVVTPTSTAASKNFTAVTSDEVSRNPPDSMGAVGPTQFIVTINGRVKSFNKTSGSTDGVLNLTLESFFAAVLQPGGYCSDPRIRYDRASGRWFVICIGIEGDESSSDILIAVSDSSTITLLSNFDFYSFTPQDVSPTSDISNYFADYPTLGIDTHALYIGANIFNSISGAFENTDAFVIPKSGLINGTINVYAFRNLITDTSGPFAPQGVDNFDDNPTYGYIIGVDALLYNRLTYRVISNPGTSPTISENKTINVASTGPSHTVPHKGNTGGVNGYLDGLDDRLICAHIRNNQLYTVHNFAVTNAGVRSFSSSDALGSRWYQIDFTNSNSPNIIQWGTLYDPNSISSNRRNYWMPSIMTNALESLLIGSSTAGTNYYANVAHALRYKNDALGTLRLPKVDTTSTSSYNPSWDSGGGEGRRWGDYSYTSLDPQDNMTMWSIQEFCSSTNKFGCRVISVKAAPPATITSCSPNSVNRSSSNINFVISGSSSNGSAFYDPPVDFEKHIQVSIGDLQIISVNVVSPTQINVVAKAKNATRGRKTLTITNPDGQKVTKTSAVTVN